MSRVLTGSLSLADMQHDDSGDDDVDPIECEKCKKPNHSVANPVLLCDGGSCGKGWHLKCLARGKPQKVAQEAIEKNLDWFCSDQCVEYEFEAIEDHRLKEIRGLATMEYLIKWKGCSQTSWEPSANLQQEDLSEYQQQHGIDSSA